MSLDAIIIIRNGETETKVNEKTAEGLNNEVLENLKKGIDVETFLPKEGEELRLFDAITIYVRELYLTLIGEETAMKPAKDFSGEEIENILCSALMSLGEEEPKFKLIED